MTALQQAGGRWLEYMPLSAIARAERNPKQHDEAGIRAAIGKWGVADLPVLDERTGRLVSGHGRLDQVEYLSRLSPADLELATGKTRPPGGIQVDPVTGEWLLPVVRGWASETDADAEAYLIGANKLAMNGASSEARDEARFMGNYSRQFSAGAFATPTAAEIQTMMDMGDGWYRWPGVAAASRQLTRDSNRLDFTGRAFQLLKGARIISHLAAEPDATLPNLDRFDWVFAYIEDTNVTRQLVAQGREARAVRVSAASEIIACWGRAGTGYTYPAVDAATLTRIPLTVLQPLRDRVVAEVQAIGGWHDDFPYYSDGSWAALSLRGFNPADPTWGVKPAEMSKSWWAEHPDATQYDKCDWTVLAEKCPATVELVQSVSWWGGLERVRLLRMAGRDGKGGSLSRHTDVTDRAAGTADGQIVRFHIPLITHPKITMSAWNLAGRRTDRHLPAWSMWYLDARKPHAVDNRAGIDRIHLVVDVVADEAARQAITAGADAAA